MRGRSGGVAHSPPGGGFSVDGGGGAQGVSAGVSPGAFGLCVGIGEVSRSGPFVVLGLLKGAGTAAGAGAGRVCGLLSRLVWFGGVECRTGIVSGVVGCCGGAGLHGRGGIGRVGAHGNGKVLWAGPLLCGPASSLPCIAVLAHCGYVHPVLPHWLPARSHYPAAHASVQITRGAGPVY